MRANPSPYAANLYELLPLFHGTLIKKPGMMVSIRTNEGATAVREAINALQRQAPLSGLMLSSGMSAAAADLVNDQRQTGNMGHTGSDGSSPGSRLNAHGSWQMSYSENVDSVRFSRVETSWSISSSTTVCPIADTVTTFSTRTRTSSGLRAARTRSCDRCA